MCFFLHQPPELGTQKSYNEGAASSPSLSNFITPSQEEVHYDAKIANGLRKSPSEQFGNKNVANKDQSVFSKKVPVDLAVTNGQSKAMQQPFNGNDIDH